MKHTNVEPWRRPGVPPEDVKQAQEWLGWVEISLNKLAITLQAGAPKELSWDEAKQWRINKHFSQRMLGQRRRELQKIISSYNRELHETNKTVNREKSARRHQALAVARGTTDPYVLLGACKRLVEQLLDELEEEWGEPRVRDKYLTPDNRELLGRMGLVMRSPEAVARVQHYLDEQGFPANEFDKEPDYAWGRRLRGLD